MFPVFHQNASALRVQNLKVNTWQMSLNEYTKNVSYDGVEVRISRGGITHARDEEMSFRSTTRWLKTAVTVRGRFNCQVRSILPGSDAKYPTQMNCFEFWKTVCCQVSTSHFSLDVTHHSVVRSQHFPSDSTIGNNTT
ncbi:hypothetical protein RvY_17469 [Ramazzottius varieornatus]|uniref:Uncharacterized protein n=1 Tax=Ramazzottius varieornatus TaxID=947166 RepID=A0A1D1W816_RAMVA|nr:hypothetical protein RvY_17469 [Ramazzottius varieornatus]